MYERRRHRQAQALPNWRSYLDYDARRQTAEGEPDSGMERLKRMNNRITSASIWQGKRLNLNQTSHNSYMKAVAGLYAPTREMRLQENPALRKKPASHKERNDQTGIKAQPAHRARPG